MVRHLPTFLRCLIKVRQIAPLVVDLQGVTACSGLVIGLQYCNSFQKKKRVSCNSDFFRLGDGFFSVPRNKYARKDYSISILFKNHVVWAISLKKIAFQ